MLVLSRRAGERIVIGENIEVSVVAIQGGRVRLAITAPRDVSIRRSELAPVPGKNTPLALGGAEDAGQLPFVASFSAAAL